MERMFKIAIVVVIVSSIFTLITYAYAQPINQATGTTNTSDYLMVGSVVVTGLSGLVAFLDIKPSRTITMLNKKKRGETSRILP
jgi:hypothetical protein